VRRLRAAALVQGRAALAGAQRVERGVDRDPVQPGEEVGAAVERAQPAVRAHEGLLGDVVRVAVVAEDVERCRVHASLMAPHQAAEGVAVAPACEIEVICLVSHPRGLYATRIGRSPRPSRWVPPAIARDLTEVYCIRPISRINL
jgi:hypothetical protein